MDSNGGSTPRRLARSPSAASRAGAGAFVYDGMRSAPLFSSTNFARSLRKAASFSYKKSSADDAAPPRRALSSKENTFHSVLGPDAALASLRRSLPEPAVASRGPWEPARRRRSTGGPSEDAGRGSGVLREMMTRKKEDPEKEEAAHRARVLTARLLQWRFANARMEMTMARTTSAAENKLFYTWLRVAELRNIQAAKRIVAQRRRQKLKLARLLRPQLPLLASWEPLAKPHANAVADLCRVLSAVCTSLPLADGAQVWLVDRPGGYSSYMHIHLQADLELESLHETMFSCVGTVNEIEANADMYYATAGVTSSALGELVRTMQQEIKGLEEAMRLARIVSSLQMQEVSLRANLIQAKQKLDLGGVVPAIATSGWCF